VITPPSGGSNAGTGSASPARPEAPKPAGTGKPTVYDTEIERAPSSVADLSGRSAPVSRTNPGETGRSATTPGERPLTPAGRTSETQRPATDGKPLTGKPYKVQSGDRLSVIAREKYGDASYVSLIKQANPGMNENRILAGTTIILPDPPGGAPTVTPGSAERAVKPDAAAASGAGDKNSAVNGKRDSAAKQAGGTAKPETAATDSRGSGAASYTVRRGDSLRKIAKTKLNDENRWREILALNKDQVTDADELEIGMTLRLPPAEKSADTKQPRTRTP
jgi:nucleoid-associated protein YgaU